MQFGVFSIGDVTQDPITGHTPTEAERIRAITEIALKAEEVGLDVFATGEHHNPPFVPSAPTTHLAYIAAQTQHLQLSTATTLISTNDPVHLAVENYHLLRRLWREPAVSWQGKFRLYFDNAPVYGHGPSLEEFTAQTPLTVGTVEQVVERTLQFADWVGDYQRQLFLIDHAGLPQEVVLEQIDILGTQVVPELRRRFEERRPDHVPSDPPTHATLGAYAPHALVNPGEEK